MRVFKDPILICTLAAVVIATGGTLFLAHSKSSDSDERAREMVAISREIAAAVSRGVVTRTMIENEKTAIKDLKTNAETTRREALQRNSKHFKVLMLTLEAGGRKIPAFPIDKQLYENYPLQYQCASRYLARREELLASLNPAAPPTPSEITEATTGLAGDDGLEGQDRPPTPLRTYPPGGPTGPSSPYGRPDGRMFGPERIPFRRTVGPTELTAPGEKSEARLALGRLIIQKAGAGDIYADEGSLYKALYSADQKYPFGELWRAQVSLWVLEDITAAIRETNRLGRAADWDDAKKRAKAKGSEETAKPILAGVPGAAVKRLLSTNVHGYVIKAGGSDGLSAVTADGMPFDRGVGAAGAAGPGGLSYLGGTSQVTPPALTRRGCGKLYDVVHYDFTVIIPARHLHLLYEQLMLRNFHTIIDDHVVQLGVIGRQTGPGRGLNVGGGAAVAANEAHYYYGPEPVVQVTVTGELLLLTEWHRGPIDAEKRERIVDKALMPESVLKMIWQQDAGALREGEVNRAWQSMTTRP